MALLRVFIILVILVPAALLPAHAAGPSTDWTSLGADAAQSDFNSGEHAITAGNALKLKVKWTTSIASESYPVVSGTQVLVPILSGSRVHARALDIATGKTVTTYPKDALGGMLAQGGNLYLAGKNLQEVDRSTGDLIQKFSASPQLKGGTFLDPVTDGKIVLVGYVSTVANRGAWLYAFDPESGTVLWKVSSASAQGAISGGRIVTESLTGSAFFDETTGKLLTSAAQLYSGWFASSRLVYTVASVNRKNAAIYAYGRTGAMIWKHTVGPAVVSLEWPHAVTPTGLYLGILKPYPGIEALDPNTGDTLWRRRLPDVERLAVANNLVFVLTYNLGQPVRVVVLHADTGKPVGALVLSPGYYAFNEPNGLMVADGMIFIRAVGPSGSSLVALGR